MDIRACDKKRITPLFFRSFTKTELEMSQSQQIYRNIEKKKFSIFCSFKWKNKIKNFRFLTFFGKHHNCYCLENILHGVWKSQKKSHSTCERSELRLHFEWTKVNLKWPKMVHFGEFLKTWSLRSNSVTKQVSFNWSKIGGNAKIIWDILSTF